MKVKTLKEIGREQHTPLSCVNRFIVAFCLGRDDDEGVELETRIVKKIVRELAIVDTDVKNGLLLEHALKQ